MCSKLLFCSESCSERQNLLEVSRASKTCCKRLQYPRGEMRRSSFFRFITTNNSRHISVKAVEYESCTNLFLWIKYWTAGARAFQGILSNMSSWCRWRDFLGILWRAKEKNVILRSCSVWASMLVCLVLSQWSKRLLNCCESGSLKEHHNIR